MGVVWLASDQLLHRDVAVKEVLWPPLLEEKERKLRQRALREARTAARLDHPNIIRVYDVVEEDRRPWIVMQLARYPSLSEVVRDDGPLPPGRAAHVGLEILAAITAAHAAGVLHRDVKPGNVLLGPEDQVVLTDFGMAIADGSPTLTTSNVLIGSPSYMAPERARGFPGTPAADLWSLGATLYAAVEGRPPFDRDGTMAVLTAVVSAEPDPPECAGPLWPVISGLLRKDPAERLGAAEAERMLRRIAGQGLASATRLDEPTFPLAGGIPAVLGGTAEHRGSQPPESSTPPQRLTVSTGRALREPSPVPGLTVRPDDHPGPPRPLPHWSGDRSPGRPARWRWLVITLAGLAVTAGAVAVLLAATHSPAERSASRSQHARSAAGRKAQANPVSPSSNRTASPSRPGPARSGGIGTAALPAGFVWYHDPTGFSIGRPRAWHVSHRGHLVYIQDLASGRFLIIDQTTQPKPDPLADWRQQEAARISTLPGYHRVRLAAVSYPQAERAADWEFTFYQNGQLTHVLNRNILVNSHRAYALYWSTPADNWSSSYHLFRVFAATFRPAGAAQGS
jgi:serine/threonine protein kinase